MRPVRFVALSEDGQALVLADEVGRLLALPIDERIAGVMHPEPGAPPLAVAPSTVDPTPSLSPRDIQARIRSGESAEDVARIAGVPVDRVLRYAGPVLQERAMLAQHARRTRLKGAEKPTPLAEVVNGRLSQHGIDTEKISWDAYRRDDGTWRIIATWPSGKATAQAIWDMDKARQVVTPHDDMAQYLCAERPTPILGQEPAPERGGHALPGPSRGEPSRGGHGLPAASEHPRPGRDPIRAGRARCVASRGP
ncbi:septation protein SepH, partial [Micromonospora tarensis]